MPNNHNNWIISGLLHNQQKDYFGFVFAAEHHDNYYHAFAGIYDIDTHKILWQHAESTQTFTANHIGRFFWNFSPINNNLIIGCQDERNKGQIFNLKIDLIEPTIITPTTSLTTDMKIKQLWSGYINGHLTLDHEEFVSSPAMWIQHTWDNNLDNQPALAQLLCAFQAGTKLFAIQVPEKNGLHAALAGLYDNTGKRISMSQFIDLHLTNIHAHSIKLNSQTNLKMVPLSSSSNYSAYLAQIGNDNGFCLSQKKPLESRVH